MRFRMTASIALLLLPSAYMFAARPDEQADALTRERQRLAGLAESRDVDGIESTGAEYERAWQAGDRDHYAALMRSLINSAKNLNLNPRVGKHIDHHVPARLVYHFASKALHHRELSVHDRTLLVVQLMPVASSPALGEVERKKALEFAFAIWSERASLIDPGYDVNMWPRRPLPPPAAGVIPGAAPDSITDPVLRAEYARVLEEYDRKAEYCMKQLELHRLQPVFDQSLAKCLAVIWSTRPEEIADLRTEMRRHFQQVDPKVAAREQDRILSMVQRAIATSQPTSALPPD